MGVLNLVRSRIRPLRERKPRAVSHKDRNAIRDVFLKDEKSILAFVRQNPEACTIQYSFRGHAGKQYPLYAVCQQKKVSVALMETVYTAYPDAIVGALHYALEQRQESLEIIQFLLKHTPDNIMAESGGCLPLHTALVNQASLKIVDYLISQDPSACRKRESKSYKLPLHLAIEHNATPNVIKLVLKHYPDAIQQADYEVKTAKESEGWLVHQAELSYSARCGTPLHAACRYKRPLAIIHYLVQAYPDAVRTKNRAGWLPLHYACAYGATTVVIEYLVTACPGSLMESTHYLFLENPTHLAIGKPDANLESIQLLIGKQSTSCPFAAPKPSLFTSYLNEAYQQETHPVIIRFLRSVEQASQKGYKYLPTRENRFHTEEDGDEEENDMSQENQLPKNTSPLPLGHTIHFW